MSFDSGRSGAYTLAAVDLAAAMAGAGGKPRLAGYEMPWETITPVAGELTIVMDGKPKKCTPGANITSVVLTLPADGFVVEQQVFFYYDGVASRAIALPAAWAKPDDVAQTFVTIDAKTIHRLGIEIIAGADRYVWANVVRLVLP